MDKIIVSILNKIEKEGYEAYIIGGFVRDYLLNIKSYDIDICTNATPKDLIKIFKKTNNKYQNYGNIKFIKGKYQIDITTYRIEHDYINNKPIRIDYSNNLFDDLKRRDFTINAMCLNKKGSLIDILNGKQDLENKVIKCIGLLDTKLLEDPTRILRAIRFATLYNFELDEKLEQSIIKNKQLIKKIPLEKLKKEIDKIITSENFEKGLTLIKKLELYDIINIKFNELIFIPNTCAMYSQVTLPSNYPLSKREKEIISAIKHIKKLGIINNEVLFKYGSFNSTLAAPLLNIDIKEVYKMNESLPITSQKDLKITFQDIQKITNKEPKEIKKILDNIIYLVLNNKLENNKKAIIKYIKEI